jgi:phosphatidylinositol-bisphosphatase
MIQHGFCLSIAGEDAEQTGVIRTNCLDCLDRTNTLQSIVGERSLQAMLGAIQHTHPVLSKGKAGQVAKLFETMWTANGNNLSKAMTGTATISSGGAVAAASRSASRTIKNNFYDGSRQRAIDALLGHDLDHAEEFDYDAGAMKETVEDSTMSTTLNVAVATWNVNGGKYLTSETPVNEWLVTPIAGRPVDVFAIGFQEIVDLKVKEMVLTSAKARNEWSVLLTKVLNTREDGETCVSALGFAYSAPTYAHVCE